VTTVTMTASLNIAGEADSDDRLLALGPPSWCPAPGLYEAQGD
jgi:hypothetical protein